MGSYIVARIQTIITRYRVEAEDGDGALEKVSDGKGEEIPDSYSNETEWQIEEGE